MKYFVTLDGRERVVELRATREGGLHVLVDGEPHPVDLAEVEGSDLYSLVVDGRSIAYAARFENDHVVLSFHDREVVVQVQDERTRLAHQMTAGARRARGVAEIRSVMPGVVREVRVREGQEVEGGQPLLILEAMKMENEIRAPDAGRVRSVHVGPGTAVEKGEVLVTLGPLGTLGAAEPTPAASAP